MAIAISDYGTLLCVEGENGKYSKLVSVTSVPDTGSAPSTIEVTELDSAVKQYISDRPDTPSYEFEANYTKENYAAVTAGISLTEEKNYLIVYQDGSGEKFTGTGAAWKKGVTAGNAVKIGLSFAVSAHEHVAGITALMSNE